MNKKKYSTGEHILSVIFLIWFVASIFGLIFTAKAGYISLTLAIFGQYFLVFGIAALASTIKDKSFKPILLLFPYVGLGTLVVGCILHWGSDSTKAKIKDMTPQLLLTIFIAAGIILLINAFLKFKDSRKCSVIVDTTCIEVKTKRSNTYSGPNGNYSNTLYCPVYEFYYNGTTYRVCDEYYSGFESTYEGESYQLKINPNNPNQFKTPLAESSGEVIVSVILGIICIAMSTIGLVLS